MKNMRWYKWIGRQTPSKYTNYIHLFDPASCCGLVVDQVKKVLWILFSFILWVPKWSVDSRWPDNKLSLTYRLQRLNTSNRLFFNCYLCGCLFSFCTSFLKGIQNGTQKWDWEFQWNLACLLKKCNKEWVLAFQMVDFAVGLVILKTARLYLSSFWGWKRLYSFLFA